MGNDKLMLVSGMEEGDGGVGGGGVGGGGVGGGDARGERGRNAA